MYPLNRKKTHRLLNGPAWCIGLPQNIMEGNISTTVQSLHLVAHVLKEQLVFIQVHLQPAPEQSQEKLHPRGGDHALPNRVAPHFNTTSFHKGSLILLNKLAHWNYSLEIA